MINEQFQWEMIRSVRKAEDYHVLRNHDFRGHNGEGKPDAIAYAQTLNYLEAMIERVPASGSCVRCQRRLGLASVKVRGRWYGSEACAEGGECPLDAREPAVPEPALYARPRRFFRRRQPKELNAGR